MSMEPTGRTSASQIAASRRNCRCFDQFTAAAGPPNSLLARAFTSQNTTTFPLCRIKSTSPALQRQLRATTS